MYVPEINPFKTLEVDLRGSTIIITVEYHLVGHEREGNEPGGNQEGRDGNV